MFILGALCSALCSGAWADDWEVRARVIRVETRGGSDAIPALSLAPDTIDVQSKTIPELDVSYFLTRNISAELVLTWPQRMNVSINQHDIGHIGTVDVLPPDLTIQYHFMPDYPIDPYLGAGVNASWLTRVHLNVPGLALTTSKASGGPVLQAGFDYRIDRHWVLNLDAKYEWMSFVLRNRGSDVSTLHVDPWLWAVGIGYKF